MNLTGHFTLEEFTVSSTAIRNGVDNTLPIELLADIRRLAETMELVRLILKAPIHIDSGYRCPQLNALVGSKPTSDHIKARAADFICPGFGAPIEICRKVADHGIDFDQIILEFDSWCHISIPVMGAIPRKQLLTIRSATEGYLKGLVA